MITYELAKELKETGFPLRQTYSADLDMFSDELSIEIDGVIYFRPTLSELIEACGDKFKGLFKDENEWSACGGKYEFDSGEFSAPEKAVARLWLALNKKS